MFISRWIIAVAFTIIASLGQAQEQAESSTQSTQNKQLPAQPFPVPLPVDIVEDQAAAEARQNREYEAREREIRDLAAQEGMNAATQSIERATRDMRDYAFYSTVAVWVGTFLLIVTLVLTWMANRAAQRAVDVTKDVGIAQLRPWISFNSWRLDGIGVQGNVGQYVIVLLWRNTGPTPALNLRALIEFVDYPAATLGNDRIAEADAKASAVAPSMSFNTQVRITPNALFLTKDEAAFVRCVVRYDTAFEGLKDCETILTFRIRYIGVGGIDVIQAGTVETANFEFRPVGSQSDRMT